MKDPVTALAQATVAGTPFFSSAHDVTEPSSVQPCHVDPTAHCSTMRRPLTAPESFVSCIPRSGYGAGVQMYQ